MTNAFVINGGKPLKGEITPQGAKNEALQVISAVLLTEEKVTISNIPDIKDPLGMMGARLEANFHIITGQISAAQNISRRQPPHSVNLKRLRLVPPFRGVAGGRSSVAAIRRSRRRWTRGRVVLITLSACI